MWGRHPGEGDQTGWWSARAKVDFHGWWHFKWGYWTLYICRYLMIFYFKMDQFFSNQRTKKWCYKKKRTQAFFKLFRPRWHKLDRNGRNFFLMVVSIKKTEEVRLLLISCIESHISGKENINTSLGLEWGIQSYSSQNTRWTLWWKGRLVRWSIFGNGRIFLKRCEKWLLYWGRRRWRFLSHLMDTTIHAFP